MRCCATSLGRQHSISTTALTVRLMEGLVQQQSSEKRGRHLVASDHLPAGKRVLREKAAAAVLYDDQIPQHCHMSFESVQSPMRCGACKHARYASKEDQRLAWTEHRQECTALQGCLPHVPPPTIRLVARLLWRQQRLNAQKTANNLTEEIFQLEHHWKSLPDSKKQLYAQMAVLTRQYMQGKRAAAVDLPDQKAIALMIARCACNNHTICNDELQPKGVGLFPTGALINHSCTPNVMQSFQQQQVTFTALQPIAAGTEITISYIELAATRAERRHQLQDQYYFDIDQDLPAAPRHEPQVQCQAEHLIADWSHGAPGHMDSADYQLTALQLASDDSPAPAHLMAMVQPLVRHADQDSFPYSTSANLQDADSDAAGASNDQRPSAVSIASASGRGLNEAAQQLTEHQLHMQCWGKGLAGITEQQLLTMAHHMSQLVDQHAQCLKALDSQAPAQAKFLAESALQLADWFPGPAKALGPRHVWRMRVLEALMRSCIDGSDDWDQASQAGRRLIPIYEIVYPKVWPNKGLHFAMLAKIAAFLGQDSDAADFAGKALQQLQYTHVDSLVLEEVRQIMFEAQKSSLEPC